MTAETAFLQALATHLGAPGRLTPTPARLGVSEPGAPWCCGWKKCTAWVAAWVNAQR